VITIGFLIVLMVVIGIHAPVDLGTFNPAGPPPHPPSLGRPAAHLTLNLTIACAYRLAVRFVTLNAATA